MDQQVAETSRATKKYKVELLEGGTVRIHLDEDYPSSQLMHGGKDRFYGSEDSRQTFFSHLVLGDDITGELPPHSGIEISGYIDVKPIMPNGNNKSFGNNKVES